MGMHKCFQWWQNVYARANNYKTYGRQLHSHGKKVTHLDCIEKQQQLTKSNKF